MPTCPRPLLITAALSCFVLVGCGDDAPDSPNWWADSGVDAAGGSSGGTGGASTNTDGNPGTGGDTGTGAGGDTGTGAGGDTGTGAGGDTSSNDGGSPGTGGDVGAGTGGNPGTAPGDLVGFWVWKQVVENGKVTLEITEADLEIKIGPDGWPGCPTNVICTNHGIRRFDFRQTGQYFFCRNVDTSSDYNQIGTFEAAANTISFIMTENWSCAHPPGGSTGQSVEKYARYKLENGDLWVESFTSTPTTSEPNKWVVFRSVSEDDFYGKYNTRTYGVTCNGGDSCSDHCENLNIPF